MIIAKNDEEKRNKVWRFVTVAASIVIILVVVFFITRLFTGNPLQGTWRSEDDEWILTIEKDGVLLAKNDEIYEGAEIKMEYELDKHAKTISIKPDMDSLQKTAEKSNGEYTVEELKASFQMIEATFDYSIEQNALVLTEREYGEQLVFRKQ